MSGKFEPGQKLTSRKLAATLGTSDMPVLTVEANGKASKAVTVPHHTLADAKGRSIMIHAGGDNYSDQPAPWAAVARASRAALSNRNSVLVMLGC
jgi:Cu/Zn superoxide dismutase